MSQSQHTLFDSSPPVKLPHRRGSETSLIAAKLAKPGACRQIRLVLQFFIDRSDDGGTDDECQVATGMDGSSQRPRRDWLSRNGYLKETENKRLTRKGCPAVVRVWTGKALPTASNVIANIESEGATNA